jgi:hypothetical protein
LQRNSFIIVLLTLVPLAMAVVTSSAGKALGNMTPWEPSKIPFLVGFAAFSPPLQRSRETYWGIPRARDIVPLLVMAMLPFVPFFALKDFGQMLIFSGAYTTLYSSPCVAGRSCCCSSVRAARDRHSCRRRLPRDIQEKCRCCRLSRVRSALRFLAHSATLSSLARRFRSAVAGSFLVEERLRRSA